MSLSLKFLSRAGLFSGALLALSACQSVSNFTNNVASSVGVDQGDVVRVITNSGARALCSSVISSSENVRDLRGPCKRAARVGLGETAEAMGFETDYSRYDFTIGRDWDPTETGENFSWVDDSDSERTYNERTGRLEWSDEPVIIRDYSRCIGPADELHASMYGRTQPSYCVAAGYRPFN